MKPGDQWPEYRTGRWLGKIGHRRIPTGRAALAGHAHPGAIESAKVALAELSRVALELRTRSAGMAADVDRLRAAFVSVVGSESVEDVPAARVLLEVVEEFEKAAQLLGVVQERIAELDETL